MPYRSAIRDSMERNEDVLMIEPASSAAGRLRNVAEERVRQRLVRASLDVDRGRRVEREMQWLASNPLFAGRQPAPGEEFGAFTERVREGWRTGARRALSRVGEKYDRNGPYASDLDLSGFTADQLVVEEID